MKKIIILSLLTFGILSCQTKNKEKKQTEKLNNNIKMINDQPIYTLNISVANPYETYINDMPLEIDYMNGSSNTELPINNFLLKSGKQSIKIVLLPKNGKTVVSTADIDFVDVQIFKYLHGFNWEGDKRKITVKEIKLKTLKDSSKLTEEFEINIDIPFQFDGWQKGVDLSKENKEILLGDLIKQYNEFREILLNRNSPEFLKRIKIREEQLNIALFLTKEEIEDDLIDQKNVINQITSVLPLENYTMRFFGNGKVISLIRLDEKLKGESALQGEFRDSYRIYNLYFYRPKAGGPLEVIR